MDPRTLKRSFPLWVPPAIAHQVAVNFLSTILGDIAMENCRLFQLFCSDHIWRWLRRPQWCTHSLFFTRMQSKCWDWEEHRHVHQTNSNPCFVILLELLGNAERTGKKLMIRSSNMSWTYRMYNMYRIIEFICICSWKMSKSLTCCAFVCIRCVPRVGSTANSAILPFRFASTETGLAPRFRSSLEHLATTRLNIEKIS